MLNIRNLYKEYVIGTIDHKSLKRDLKFFFNKLLKNKNSEIILNEENKKNKIIALNNINLKISKGEIVGLIGKNGSGKSTLLKIISKITSPTNGEIELKGKVASLLEVGVGFHPELTGLENIYLNGSIFGLEKNEIAEIENAIVKFSEVEKFIKTPIKRYSSGMLVKLGFSIAAHLRPDIFIVDEVLAVGDHNFRQKALSKILEFSKEKEKVVFFVSHNMDLISKICNRCVLLKDGQVDFDGDPQVAINRYLDK
tara:strand:+ start:556 stop:1317 length:762 start_codon:yes stop_codon:yes gene_type:complete